MTKSNIKSWSQIKDKIYGRKGSARRDKLDRETESFKKRLSVQQERESDFALGSLIDKVKTGKTVNRDSIINKLNGKT